MGERTQLLVRTTIHNSETGNNTEFIQAYHYQWGIGKVMPNAALRLVLKAAYFTIFSLDISSQLKNDASENMDILVGALQKVITNELVPERPEDLLDRDDLLGYMNEYQGKNISKLSKLERQNIIFDNPDLGPFDNNDGYQLLELDFTYDGSFNLHFSGGDTYFMRTSHSAKPDKEATPYLFEEWCKDWNDYIPNEWAKEYVLFMKAYDIELA